MSDLLTAKPSETVTITESGIPTGSTVGYQIVKALSNITVLGRTTVAVVERPSGSGNFVIPFIAPVEDDLYLLVIDYKNGTIDEESIVRELQVTSVTATATPTGLGAIADWAKAALGGETWKGLAESENYGTDFISKAIESVKQRVMSTPPATEDENQLSTLVLSYLGKLAALQLLPAARDYWGNQQQSISIGDDPVEIATYPNRNTMLDALKEDLVAQVVAEQDKALALIGEGLRVIATRGPIIDEDNDTKVTADPRDFPSYDDFPYTHDERVRIRGGVMI